MEDVDPNIQDVDRDISRRDFIRFAGGGVLGLGLAACGVSEPNPAETPETSSTVTPESTIAPAEITTTTTETRQIELDGEFTAEPTWFQNFLEMDGTPGDHGWNYELWHLVPTWNQEEQAYTDSPDNARIEPGEGLIIEARKESFVYPNDPEAKAYEYTSARIDSRGLFSMNYGRLEATIKMPKGEGTWPAFWFLSENQPHTTPMKPTDDDWAKPRFYAHDGELDIVEAYGNRPGYIEGTVHTFNGSNHGSIDVPDASEEFHTYGVEVTPDKITWLLDGESYYEFERPSDASEDWPFTEDNDLYFIFNLAMGGPYGGEIDDSQAEHWQMIVQDIKFYDYAGNLGSE